MSINTIHVHSTENNKIFGFWLYLMSDSILFSALLATYAVLNNDLSSISETKYAFNISFVLIETIILLCSSFTCSLVMLVMHQNKKKYLNIWLGITFLLGLLFVFMEIYEFYHMMNIGYDITYNASFSSFFSLIGAHGLHIISGLIWILLMMIQISYQGCTIMNKTRLQCLSLFWHFLDIIWICIFTVVYLI